MKSIELFCASPASTAICSTMDHKSMIRRSIDRNVHHRRPCSSNLPFDPSHHKITRKTSSGETLRRKICADADDRPSRYLLSDEPGFLDSDKPLVNYTRLNSDVFPGFRSFSTRSYESPVYNPSSTNDSSGKSLRHHLKSPAPPSNHQVIELRVSIHCKGCEGKLRKHIARMEGVRSFSIDLSTKKVTVIGDVTPVGVLTSISKVKNAQFWPSPTSSSSPKLNFPKS